MVRYNPVFRRVRLNEAAVRLLMNMNNGIKTNGVYSRTYGRQDKHAPAIPVSTGDRLLPLTCVRRLDRCERR